MTLLLTECSDAGVVMAADSAISRVDSAGRITSIDHQTWVKVLKAQRIKALVGYWGLIGRIHSRRFDEWLTQRLAALQYSDLPSLATALSDDINAKCGNRPLTDDACAGLHVAGYHEWQDGVRRPYFFHVNNGPGHYEVGHRTVNTSQGPALILVNPVWKGGPRSLFAPQLDFPNPNATLQDNLAALQAGHLTRNGDFFYYSVIWDHLSRAFAYLNRIPHFSIPAVPGQLGPRKGLLIAAVETTIRLYKCSNQKRTVGGKVTAEAIGPRGYHR